MVTLSSESRNQLRAGASFGIVLALLLVASFALTVPVLAKGPIEKITVSGQWVTEPIEIIDSASLVPLEPWPAGLIAWDRGRIAEPPRIRETYQVSFYLAGGGMFYALRYSPSSLGGPGYIYVPGRGDPEYSRNIGRIGTGDEYTRNAYGEWYHASDLFGTLMKDTLNSAGNSPTSEAPGVGRKAATVWGLALGALVLLGAAAASVRLRLRRRLAS